MKKIVLILFILVFNRTHAQTLVHLPDTISGTSFTLAIHHDSVQFFSGKKTQTFGINSMHYLGPTLMMKQGDSVNITVNNQMGDTTTMHWHGLHVAAKNDGGPHSMIMDGMSWTPGFVVRNRAALYWYHSHMMGKTAPQVAMGDVGMIIVRDNAEAALNLPRRYGVDDFPLVVQSVAFNTQNQFQPYAWDDSVIVINGAVDSPFINMPAQVVRMRLLNGSVGRAFNFGFTANRPFKVIGDDNGLLQAPVSATRIRLTPGERAEILVDFGGLSGQKTYLVSYASELAMGVMGGPMPPMGMSGMNSPLNGIDFNLMKIFITAPTTTPVTSMPATLVPDTPYSVTAVNGHRTIIFTSDTPIMPGIHFYLNHKMFDMDSIDYKIKLGNTEIWTLIDSNVMGHPFHIHDAHFYILDRNGNPPDSVEMGRKDVVLVHPFETVRFITRFDDFEDTTIPYMYHCHMLDHEDRGMMGQFLVGANYTRVKNTTLPQNKITIFPNPANDMLSIATGSNEPAKILITDAIGRVVYSGTIMQKTTLPIANWSSGIYIITIKQDKNITRERFVVE